MNLSQELLVESGMPKGISIGKKYSLVLVDGESFKDLILTGVSNNVLKFRGKSGEKHTFNPFEQDVELK